jgi:DNA polymerase-3 subunit chi
MRVVFYDIAPAERFQLAAKMAAAAWEKKKTLILRCHDDELDRLDTHLWTFRDESFLPHEVWRSGATLADEHARILLVSSDETPRPGHILLQLAPASLEFARTFDTVIDVVDHTDEPRLTASRARYKAWAEQGLKPELKKSF